MHEMPSYIFYYEHMASGRPFSREGRFGRAVGVADVGVINDD
jgi:hypothetical protein